MIQNKASREMCLSAIKMGDELYHYGVVGMSWGDRNGPPYPLGGIDKREARAEYKAKREKEKRLEKMRKIAAKKRKEEKRAERKQEKLNKWKEKLIMNGNMEKIYKKRKYFTNDEIEYAMGRNAQLTEARYMKNSNKAKDPNAINKLVKFAGTIQQVATSVLPAIQVAKGMKEIKALDTKALVDDAKFRSDAIYTKIEKIRQFDPDMAAKLLGDELGGIEIKNKPKALDQKDINDRIKLIQEQIKNERTNAEKQHRDPDESYINELQGMSRQLLNGSALNALNEIAGRKRYTVSQSTLQRLRARNGSSAGSGSGGNSGGSSGRSGLSNNTNQNQATNSYGANHGWQNSTRQYLNGIRITAGNANWGQNAFGGNRQNNNNAHQNTQQNNQNTVRAGYDFISQLGQNIIANSSQNNSRTPIRTAQGGEYYSDMAQRILNRNGMGLILNQRTQNLVNT